MKKMKLSLAFTILKREYYKRKCKNVSKILNPKKFIPVQIPTRDRSAWGKKVFLS